MTRSITLCSLLLACFAAGCGSSRVANQHAAPQPTAHAARQEAEPARPQPQQQSAADRREKAAQAWKVLKQRSDELAHALDGSDQGFAAALKQMMDSPSDETYSTFKSGSVRGLNLLIAHRDQLIEVRRFADDEQFDLLESEARAQVMKELRWYPTKLAQLDIMVDKYSARLAEFRQRTVEIRADGEWQSVDEAVRTGDTIFVQAIGTWAYASAGHAVGPQGEDGNPADRIQPRFANGALLARVDDLIQEGSPFLFALRDGQLQFRINDNDVKDNAGVMTLCLWIIPK